MSNFGRKASGLLLLSLGFLLLPGGCTMVVDDSSLQAGCDDGTKVCESTETGFLECVSTTNPAYGCGADACSPCTLPHSAVRCSNEGECVIATCSGSYKDCNGKASDGCEVDTATSDLNCGACGEECSAANAATTCGGSTCNITFCYDGFADCDKKPSNGCEVDTTSSNKHCGGCNQPCAGTCNDGVCQ